MNITSEVYVNKAKVLENIELELNVKINYELRNKENVIVEAKTVPFKSFVLNFAKALKFLFHQSSGNMVSTTNNSFSLTDTYFSIKVNEGASTTASSNYGIVFGDASGRTPQIYLSSVANQINPILVGANDYTLYRRFAHSEILLTNTSVTALSPDKLVISRGIINDSIANESIYITEIGLVGLYDKLNNEQSRYVLLARDIIASLNNPIEIPYGYVLNVQYIFETNKVNSYTNNFISLLSSLFVSGNSLSNAVNTSGISEIINYGTLNGDVRGFLLADVTKDQYGIVLGSKVSGQSNDILPTTYNIPNKISNSMISYGSTTEIPISITSNAIKFGISRIFENPSTTLSYRVGSYGIVMAENVNSPNKYYLISGGKVLTNTADHLLVNPLDVFRISYFFNFPISNKGDGR